MPVITASKSHCRFGECGVRGCTGCGMRLAPGQIKRRTQFVPVAYVRCTTARGEIFRGCLTAYGILASIAAAQPEDRVRVRIACERCGSEKPSGQSCGCFDNGCE